MTTPDWTSGIVEAMAKAICASLWESTESTRGKEIADHFFEHSYMSDEDKEECEDYRNQAKSALAVALPMIGELIANDLEKLLIRQELLLRTGEMGVQEIRSCMAVLKYTFARIRDLTTSFEKSRK